MYSVRCYMCNICYTLLIQRNYTSGGYMVSTLNEKVVKAATVNTRMDYQTKKEVENILNQMGLTTAEVVRMLFAQILLHRGLPFAIKIPSKETLEAIHDIEAGNTFKAKSGRDILKK